MSGQGGSLMAGARFIQICAAKYDLYALDEAGGVWHYKERTRRVPDEKCEEYQTVVSWEPLTMNRGPFTGWPPTEAEMAANEVEEILRNG